MHRITYSVSLHGIIKSNIWQCYCEQEKENSLTYKNTTFITATSDCLRKTPKEWNEKYYTFMKVTVAYNVACTMHFCTYGAMARPCSYKDLLSPTGDKAVTRTRCCHLHLIPGNKTAFHRLIHQTEVLPGTFSIANVSLIKYIHHKIWENVFCKCSFLIKSNMKVSSLNPIQCL